jgi:hypothetical protein
MSILHYNIGQIAMNQNDCIGITQSKSDERFARNPAHDLKEGIDLVFELKTKIDKMHPMATETLIRLLCM